MGDAPTPSYVFFSAIEIATTAFIVQYAWTWRARTPEDKVERDEGRTHA